MQVQVRSKCLCWWCWCCAKLMVYGPVWWSSQIWHPEVDGWRRRAGRQTSLVVRRQRINGAVSVIVEVRDGGSGCPKSSTVSRPGRLQKRQDQAR